MDRLPLVFDPVVGGPQQLPAADDLNIPLCKRVEMLERQLTDLTQTLIDQGIDVPESLIV